MGDLAYTVMLGCVVLVIALALRGAQWAVERTRSGGFLRR